MNIAERDYMQAFESGHWSTVVGETIRGKTSGSTAFNIARPLIGPDGHLRGAIVVAAFPSYFAKFYTRTSRRLDHSDALG